MLTMLRTRVESLDGLRAGVTQEALDDRLTETDEALAGLSQRVEELATGVESATASLSDKEHEVAALHRHFMESSSRIETIVDDLREALGAFTDTDPDALAALTRRLDTTSAGAAALANRVERLEATHVDDLLTGLAERIDVLDGRVEAVAIEIRRAKTLWPVALRSLEARARRRRSATTARMRQWAERAPRERARGRFQIFWTRDSLPRSSSRPELEPAQDAATRTPEDTQQAIAGAARSTGRRAARACGRPLARPTAASSSARPTPCRRWARGDHQTEVGDVRGSPGCGSRASDRRPRRSVAVLGDEHGRVGMARATAFR